MAEQTIKKDILDSTVEAVQLNRIKTYPGNPRRGDIEAIMESLEVNGQFRPLIVQRSTSFVLGGNHTYMAAKKLKWKTVKVVYLDVNDEEAKKIVIADNRTSDLADYDNDALAGLLSSITDVAGTGYTDDELKSFLTVSESAARDILIASPEMVGNISSDPLEGDFGDDGLLEGEVADYAPGSDGEESFDDGRGSDELEKASDELPGLVQLKDDFVFDGASIMDIPILRADMFVEQLPEKLLTWAGMPTRNWSDPDVWWWFNYGSERTAGMNDPSKMLLAFYAYDHYFDNWFYYPDRYVSKALNTGVKMAITPNFSCEGMPRALSIWALYRSRWLGRYMQEAGIRIIPDIEWRVGEREYLDKFVLAGIPKNLPYISIQAQNLQTNNTMKDRSDEEKAKYEKSWKDDLQHIVDTLNPKTLIVYSNLAEYEVVNAMPLSCETHWQKTRLMMWNELAPKREKRTTL